MTYLDRQPTPRRYTTGPDPLLLRGVRGVASVTFSAGLGTLTHGLGAVPAVLIPSAILGTSGIVLAVVGTPTSTTAQLRAWQMDGTPYSSTLSAVQYLAIA